MPDSQFFTPPATNEPRPWVVITHGIDIIDA
jgi:hypothetical protein